MNINVGFWAKKTVGFSGADIQNLVNTAAIHAASEDKEMVCQEDFEFSFDKQTLGVDLKSRVRDMEDMKITAFHEAGHTLVAYYNKEAMPIHKVTIIAKGQSGGHTAFIPKDNQWHQTRIQLLARMDVAMGGRAAEELIFGKEKVTGGASSDLNGATGVAEAMVKKLAMSDNLGLRHISDEAIANGLVGDSTKTVIDTEVNTFLEESYTRAMNVLKTHRKELDLLADALLNYETLDGDEVKSVIEGKTLTRKKVVRQSESKSKVDKGKHTPTPLIGAEQLMKQCKTY
jgi:ATP-dependent metalloprotease